MASNNQLCIRRWTTKNVARWLKEEGFCEYVDLLCNRHRLDGITLLTLTEYDLRSPPLEIKILGDIKRLMLSIRKLQKQHIDVLEELGYSSEGHAGTASPAGSLQGADWFCNGEVPRDCDGPISDLNGDQYQYANGKNKHATRRLDPEYWKTVLSCVYVFIVFGFTSFVMVIVHERVPDMQTYPPLPDIFLDSVPRIPWAFAMTEIYTSAQAVQPHGDSISITLHYNVCYLTLGARTALAVYWKVVWQCLGKTPAGICNMEWLWNDSDWSAYMWRLYVQWSHCRPDHAQLLCHRIYAKELELLAYLVLGPESLWNLLHFGCT
uniref:Sphingomyelin synthase-related protein 1 n=1 Tax=Cyanistes caeruleus TaxID=156563 RepID=A0A8C0ZCF9_CYACU